MIHAYHAIYLNKAQSTLGVVFDYAINICGINGNDFIKMFTISSVSKRMEKGEAALLCGRSGLELLMDIIRETMGQEIDLVPVQRLGRSREYWIGWALAYYQWFSGRKYQDIFSAITLAELENMYFTLHEADITKFASLMDTRMQAAFPDTNLKRLRSLCGCTQAELAMRSGVSLRSIQMYEQRHKNINKASGDTIYALAVNLGCNMEDLLEPC